MISRADQNKAAKAMIPAIEEGSKCLFFGCEGEMQFEEVEDCCCHISPPCYKCVENPLVCSECGSEQDEFN